MNPLQTASRSLDRSPRRIEEKHWMNAVVRPILQNLESYQKLGIRNLTFTWDCSPFVGHSLVTAFQWSYIKQHYVYQVAFTRKVTIKKIVYILPCMRNIVRSDYDRSKQTSPFNFPTSN